MWTRDLSLGTHVISVEVADQSGNSVILTKDVEVVPGSLAAPRLEGDVPAAEMLVRLGPDNLEQFEVDGVDETPADPAEAATTPGRHRGHTSAGVGRSRIARPGHRRTGPPLHPIETPG